MQIVLEKTPAVSFLLGKQSTSTATVYRRASFCVVTEVGGHGIAYNTLTKELADLDSSELELLSRDEIGVTDKSIPFIQGYYLVPLDHDDEKLCDGVLAFIRSAVKSDDVYRRFTVFPTTDCNARCFYCYELGRAHLPMSAETAEKTAQFIIKASHRSPVSITWYGGEPLMNTDAMDIISAALEKSGMAYSSRLVTNASLIDDEIIRKAKKLWHVEKVQVSLDGTSDVYDRIKAYTDRESGFETVLCNIGKLLDNDIKVNIRLNIDIHNIDNIHALCDVLVSRFGGRSGLNVYSELLFDCEGARRPVSSPDDRLRLAKELISLEDKCALCGLLRPRKLRRVENVSFCKADAPDSLVITAEGNLVKCDFFTDERFAGNVYDGVDKAKLDAEADAFTKRVKCRGCTAYPVCLRSAGCPTGGCDAARKYITEQRLIRSIRYVYTKERS